MGSDDEQNDNRLARIHQAFLDNFTLNDLDMLLRLKFNRNLEDYAGAGDRPAQIFQMLTKVEREGWLDELVAAAVAKRKNDPVWQELLNETNTRRSPVSGLRSPVKGLAYNDPYPLEAGFTGRAAELALLDHWYAGEPDKPLLVIIALGGEGKSALAWYWQEKLRAGERPVAAPEQVIWWNFYATQAGPQEFLEQTLAYFGVGGTGTHPRQYLSTLYRHLQENRTLLILDGAERILRAYSGMNAVYQGDDDAPHEAGSGLHARDCEDPVAETLLRDLSGMRGVKTLLTSRLMPRALYGRGGGLQAGVGRHDLTGLDPEAAWQLFSSQGIQATRADVVAAGEPLGYHPLSLRLLAGYAANDLAFPGDLNAAADYDPTADLMGRREHVLLRAYENLSPPAQHTLSTMAAFRGSVSWNTIAAVFKNGHRLRDDFRPLVQRGLLQRTGQQAVYDLHPIVRRYAYRRLADSQAVHAQLAEHFRAVPPPEEVKTLADLQSTIEGYHHLARSGRYDEAFQFFRDRLQEHLYYQLGAYQQVIALLNALVPYEEGKPANLSDENDQAWTLSVLANSYHLSGRPLDAIRLYERQIVIGKHQGDLRNQAIGLINLAYQKIAIGELAAAEENIDLSVILCQESENRLYEAIAHREWGRLQAYCGHPAGVVSELNKALALFVQPEDIKYKSALWAYRALAILLNEEGEAAISARQAAQEAYRLAEESARTGSHIERNFIQALWLLGWCDLAVKALTEAQRHLDEALRRCRAINLVILEPAILLAHARLAHARDDTKNAGRFTEEALSIAQRARYRLDLADIHNYLARLALAEGNPAEARAHAQQALDFAACDGPSHAYQSALNEADQLLAEMGAV